jgi:hypothetical protein
VADLAAIAQLRRNVADDEPVEDRAWSDIELGERIDAHGGSVERVGLSDYSTGTVSEKGSQVAAQLAREVALWESIVAGLDAAVAEAARATSAPQTVAVPVQVIF